MNRESDNVPDCYKDPDMIQGGPTWYKRYMNSRTSQLTIETGSGPYQCVLRHYMWPKFEENETTSGPDEYIVLELMLPAKESFERKLR